jgi:predicted Fe-S protein YdhL (DUF1289 family)
MKIKMKKVKDGPNFCFCCGRTLDKTEYVLDFGTSGSTFELCKGCLKSLRAKADRALIAELPNSPA